MVIGWPDAMLVIIASGCSRLAGAQQVHNLTWSRIALPAGVRSVLVGRHNSRVAGRGRASSGGDHPVLFVVDASGAVRPVPLHPHSPYAESCRPRVVSRPRPRRLLPLASRMAEHTRTSDGPCGPDSRDGLDDYPQTFETFGGQSAGGLLDIVFTSEGAEIAGTWAAPEGGLDAAVMAAPRAQLGPPELDWHRARQHTAAPSRTTRRHRRRSHDHLRLGDHL